MKKQALLLIALFLAHLFACQKHPSVSLVLQEAENLMESHPDSSLTLLEGIQSPEMLSKAEYATWCLLVTQARDKNYVEHTSDSVINVAIDYFSKRPDLNRQAQAYYCKGRVLSDLLESDEALEAYLKAYDCVKETSNYPLKARICNHMGTLYWKNNAKLKCLDSYKLACSAYGESRDTSGIVNALKNIGRSYAGLEQSDSALFYYKEALSLVEGGNNDNQKSDILTLIGRFWLDRRDYNLALEYNLTAMNMTSKKTLLYSRYYTVGTSYEGLQRYDSALFYAKRALEGGGLDIQCSSHRLLYLIYSKTNQYEKAFQHNEMYIQLKDSIEHRYQPEAMAKAEALYNKARLENKQNRQIRELENEQNIWIVSALLACLIFTVLYFCLERRIREQKRQMRDYERQLQESNHSLITYQQKICEQNELLDGVQTKLNDSQCLLDDYVDKIHLLEEGHLETKNAHMDEIERVKEVIHSLTVEKEAILVEKTDLMSKSEFLLEQQSKLLQSIESLSKDRKELESQIGDLEKQRAKIREVQKLLEKERQSILAQNEAADSRLREVCGAFVAVAIKKNPYISKLVGASSCNQFTKEDWIEFEKEFDQVFCGFREYLVTQFLDLSERDVRIFCLTRLGLKTKILAEIFNLDDSTIRKIKSDLRDRFFSQCEKRPLEKLLKTWF